MKENEKKALVSLLGGVGFIVLLIGLFTPLYEFMYGLVAAIAIWVITGAVSTYLGVKKEGKKKKQPKDKTKDFKTHLVVYLVIIGMLFIINIFTTPGDYWVVWPAFLWGGIVVLHGLLTYVVK